MVTLISITNDVNISIFNFLNKISEDFIYTIYNIFFPINSLFPYSETLKQNGEVGKRIYATKISFLC